MSIDPDENRDAEYGRIEAVQLNQNSLPLIAERAPGHLLGLRQPHAIADGVTVDCPW